MQVPPLLLTRLGTPDFISKFNPFTTGYSEEKATKTLTVFKMKKRKRKKAYKFACTANPISNYEIRHYKENFTVNKRTKTVVLFISLKIFPNPAKMLHTSY